MGLHSQPAWQVRKLESWSDLTQRPKEASTWRKVTGAAFWDVQTSASGWEVMAGVSRARTARFLLQWLRAWGFIARIAPGHPTLASWLLRTWSALAPRPRLGMMCTRRRRRARRASDTTWNESGQLWHLIAGTDAIAGSSADTCYRDQVLSGGCLLGRRICTLLWPVFFYISLRGKYKKCGRVLWPFHTSTITLFNSTRASVIDKVGKAKLV